MTNRSLQTTYNKSSRESQGDWSIPQEISVKFQESFKPPLFKLHHNSWTSNKLDTNSSMRSKFNTIKTWNSKLANYLNFKTPMVNNLNWFWRRSTKSRKIDITTNNSKNKLRNRKKNRYKKEKNKDSKKIFQSIKNTAIFIEESLKIRLSISWRHRTNVCWTKTLNWRNCMAEIINSRTS